MRNGDEPRLTDADRLAIERIQRELDREFGHPAGPMNNGTAPTATPKRRLTGWLLTVGAIGAVVAALAFVVFWPAPAILRAPTAPRSSPGLPGGELAGGPGRPAPTQSHQARARSAAPPIAREVPPSTEPEQGQTLSPPAEQERPNPLTAEQHRSSSPSTRDGRTAREVSRPSYQASAPARDRSRPKSHVVASSAVRQPLTPFQAP